MAMYNYTNYSDFSGMYGGALIASLIAIGIFLLILLVIAAYVYTALAWRDIAKKRGYKKSWIAWIPIANIAMWLQLGGFH